MKPSLSIVLLLVTLAYANHFHNAFQFDDSYAIVDNPYVTDLHNTPKFFEDARTNDALPGNQVYRPLLSVSFAVDYWLARGFDPTVFHATTFLWYLLQLSLMFGLFRWIFDRAETGNAWNESAALFATALYGLHPAMAETVSGTTIMPMPMPPTVIGMTRFGKYGMPPLRVEP